MFAVRSMAPSTCPKCGSTNPEMARFCGQCGAVFAVSSPLASTHAPTPGSSLAESRLAARTLVEFSAPSERSVPAAPPAAPPPGPAPAVPSRVDSRAFASTIVEFSAPEHIPAPATASAASSKQTMIGMPISDLLAALPKASPAPAVSPAPAEPAPSRDRAFGMASTMLGVAMPGIAPVAAGAAEAPRSPGYDGRSGTMLGVAIPGIAPLQPGLAQTRPLAPQAAPRPRSFTDAILPMPAPLVDEPVPQAPERRAKRGVPVAAVAGGIAAVLAIAGVAIAVLWKSAPPIVAAPGLDAQNRDVLHLTCESCKDGTVVELDGTKAPFAGGKADVLVKTLTVGQNPFILSINRPGIGRDETVKIVVPVAFRIRADLSGIGASPPVIAVRVEADPDSDVRVDGKPLALDAQGKGSYPIDIDADTRGPSDDAKQIERKIPYAITIKGKPAAEQGEVTARMRVVPLHLDGPGSSAIIEGSTFVVAGQTTTGATLNVNGEAVKLEPSGAFARTMEAMAGETRVEVTASAPGVARRIVRFKVKRVEHLDAEAKAADASTALLTYDAIASDIAGKIGQAAVIEGEVVEARVPGHQTILLIADRRGCAASRPTAGSASRADGACLARVLHGASDDGTPAAPLVNGQRLAVRRGDTVRAYGHVTRAVTTSAGKSVPEVEADFVIRTTK